MNINEKDELDRLVDQGLERLSKKAAIQSEERANEKSRKLIICWALVFLFLVVCFGNAIYGIVVQGDYTGLIAISVIGILSFFIFSLLYKDFSH